MAARGKEPRATPSRAPARHAASLWQIPHGALILVLICWPLAAQNDSRSEEIQKSRQRRAPELAPDEPSNFEQLLNTVRQRKAVRLLTTGISGFRVRVGGLVTGSSIAAGPEYIRRDLAGGNLQFRTSARASFLKFQLYDMELSGARLANNKLFFDLYAVHRNYPYLDYYGPGPHSARTGRSAFRLEDTGLDAVAGVRPFSHFRLGLTSGYLLVNIGPGIIQRSISTDKIYSPLLAPGIDRQSNFLRTGGFVEYDYRNIAGGPRRGGRYLMQFSDYSDRKLDQNSFRRLDLEAQQYVPFFNERRVIALRAKSALTWADAGQRVPFYLQPTLGGADDLRGFRNLRFYDDNNIILNGEYRWEVFSGLDMALFADAGKVFRNHSDWSLSDLEKSYGFGFRFNARNNVFLRIDFGFSREAFQVWAKFHNVFLAQ